MILADSGESKLAKAVDPSVSLKWIQAVDTCGSQWWILMVDPVEGSGGFWWIQVVDPGISQLWILVDPSGFH